MLYLTNALSLNMFPRTGYFALHVYDVTLDDAAVLLYIAHKRLYNAIGHADTDALLRELLRETVPFPDVPQGARHTIVVTQGDGLLVAQYRGPRLPEGGLLCPTPSMFTFAFVSLVDRVQSDAVHRLIQEYRAGAQSMAAATQVPEDVRIGALWSVAVRTDNVHPRTLLEFVLWEKDRWQDVCGAACSEGAGAV